MTDNVDGGVRIPQTDFKNEQFSLKCEYETMFGKKCTDANTNQKFETKQEMIDTYARNILFWSIRLPPIEANMTSRALARHAICKNSIDNLKSRCCERDMGDEVSEALERIKAEMKS